MAGPAPRNLSFYRGDDYSHEISFTDNASPPVALDLSEHEFSAQIRPRAEKSSILFATFTIDTSQAEDGIIVLHLNQAQTRIDSGFWDLEVTNDGKTHTWLKGTVTVDGDVTQEVTP